MICAICDETNNTNRLCASCRADPANADWFERENEEVSSSMDLASNERVRLAPMSTWLDTKLRNHSELYRRIVRMLLVGEPYVYIDQNGRRRGVRYRRVLSCRRVAELCDCSYQYVHKVRAELIAMIAQ